MFRFLSSFFPSKAPIKEVEEAHPAGETLVELFEFYRKSPGRTVFRT